VSVVKVTVAPPFRTMVLVGDVQPQRRATLYAKVSGYVKDVLVDKGDSVRKVQVLGTLEFPDGEQSALAASSELALKRSNAERYRELLGRGFVSKRDAEQAATELKVAATTYVRARWFKNYGTIRAPFDGVITARHADPGALLQAATSGAQGALPLVDVADLARVRVRVYVGPLDAPFVREGIRATLWTDARPDRPREAAVTRITRALDASTRTMLCEIEVDNADGSLYAGTPVHVRLAVETAKVPVIPAEALTVRDGRPHVVVVRDGRAAFVPVDVGEDDGRIVRIRSGVREGDIVVLSVGDDVTEGAPLQPVFKSVGAPTNATAARG
jgi:RND family efflux transporter MFP subunit